MPLYVADAMDAAEREGLRRHLAAGCVACVGHLAEATATFASVGLGLDPVVPSPDLLRRTLDRIDRKAVPGRPASSRWRWAAPAAAAALAAALATYAAVTRHDRAAVAQTVEEARFNYNNDARAMLLRSALADRDQTVDQLRSRLAAQQQVVDALRAPGVRVLALAGVGQKDASAQLVWAPTAGRSALLVSRLAPPHPGRTYELWFITADQKAVPAGTFTADAGGSAVLTAAVPPGLGPLAVAAVSDEPAGGTASPTGQIQLAGKVP